MNTALEPVKVNFSPDNQYFTENREFQGIPGIEKTEKGTLWATWYTGGVNEGPLNYVVLVRSDDDGKTWTEPLLVVDPPGNIRAYDPTLWIDPIGKLWLFWAQCSSLKDGNISDGKAGVWCIKCDNPDDANTNWTEPQRIANGIMMNKPVVLSNGEWAFPTAVWKNLGGGNTPDELLEEMYSNITVSADQGETFVRRGGADIPNRGFDEHMIVELQDGRLWMLVRTATGVGESFSSDLGKTWTPGKDGAFEGPGSRFFIRRLKSGRLLLINHQQNKEDIHRREMLTAYLSDDDGKSWYGRLVIDEREGVSYPDGTEDNDGNIYIIYDWQRYKAGDILFAKFAEEDIKAGKIVSERSSLKNLINHSGGVRG